MTKLQKLFEQATARPWNTPDSWDEDDRICIVANVDGEPFTVAHVLREDGAGTCPDSEWHANARLIALAANHFEAMVNTMKEFVEDVRIGSPELKHEWPDLYQTYLHARSVLAAIEKELP